jgi:hypothetical protein
MKAIVAILLLATAGAALADTAGTAKSTDRPIVIYKAGKPYIFDGRRIQCCATNQPAEKPAPVKPVRAVG